MPQIPFPSAGHSEVCALHRLSEGPLVGLSLRCPSNNLHNLGRVPQRLKFLLLLGWVWGLNEAVISLPPQLAPRHSSVTGSQPFFA